jgi:hypothetical protein
MTLTLIARMLRRANLADELIALQKERIDGLKREVSRMVLEHTRELQGIQAAWLISLEQPEIDMRDTLVAAVEELGHQIAALEEHIVR